MLKSENNTITKEINKINDFYLKNKFLMFLIMCITIITYAPKIFYYNYSLDTQIMINNPYSCLYWWIEIERWGLAFFKLITSFGMNINVAFINIITYILLAISAIILSYIFWRVGIKKEYLYLGSFIYLTSPVIIEQTNWILQSVEVVFAFCVLYIGILMIQLYFESKKSYFIYLSTILTIIAFSIYPSLITAFITLSLAIIYLTFKDKGLLKYLKKGLICSIVFVISFITNKLITWSLVKILKLHEMGPLYSSWIWRMNFQDFVFSFSKSFIQYFILYNQYFLFATTFLSLFLIMVIFKKKIGIESKFTSFTSIVGIYITCILPLVMLGGIGPIRVYPPTVPIALFFLTITFLSNLSKPSLKKISVILLLILCFGQMKISSDFGMSEKVQFEQEILLLNEIKALLSDLNINNTEQYKLAVIGKKTFHNNQIIKGDSIGVSFFEFGDETPVRTSRNVNEFFFSQGLKFSEISSEEYQKALTQRNNMGNFPDKNSIKIIGDILILKFE
jgi:hypothetical protein